MTAAAIAAVLHGRKSGSGWMARCPAHEDRNPSLSISDSGGRVLVHCHAGCEQRAVVAALRDRGLWPESTPAGERHRDGIIVRTHDYRDEAGVLLYQVCRLEPKSFRPRRPDGNGGWRWGLGNARRVLYNLPALLEAPIIFVCEGERDCDTLAEHGFVATTNPGGAGKWRPEYSEFFRGREAVLVPDNDEPGRAHMADVAKHLLGVAACIRIFQLPHEYKDLTAFFAAGRSECEFLARLEGPAYA